MGKLYEGLDRLKDFDVDLVFPQIVVIGDESTGKSSLIERIAMFSFFPRGNKSHQQSLCTRMPIKLCMKRLNKEELMKFTEKNNLQFKENCCWVRLRYEPVQGNPKESAFFSKDIVETKVTEYMELAAKSNTSCTLSELK